MYNEQQDYDEIQGKAHIYSLTLNRLEQKSSEK